MGLQRKPDQAISISQKCSPLAAVWPDVEIKRTPNLTIRSQKVVTAVLLKRDVFQRSSKSQ